MKIVGLDIGDQWTGTAISDALRMFARPYKTTPTKDLIPFLETVLAQEPVTKIVIGYPKTMRGTVSDQTKKVEAAKEKLEQHFPNITWILWDERLSSKRAQTLKAAKTKEEKIQSHSVAAAFILSSYLEFRPLDSIDNHIDEIKN
ncbi:MAG: Holliday junction resolvase RuvX [Candidatus Dependentiae bacterium]|nr:Holliday junction resolvase RuvX [Candidatus Dependentiae bacterium]